MEHPHTREMGHSARPDMEPFSLRRLDETCQKMVLPATICSVVNCFAFISTGEILVESGGKSVLATAGDLLLIPQGVSFTINHYKDCQGFMGGFHNSFLGSGAFSQENIRQVKILNGRTMVKCQFPQEQIPFISSLFGRIVAEISKGKYNMDLVKCLMMSVLAEANTLFNGNDNLFAENACDLFLRQLFDEEQPLRTIPEYAELLHVTPNYLNKLVKRETGKPVSQWIDDSVIIRAKAMLCETDLSVADISAELNIMDSSYFARKFKKITTLTPLGFKKKYK